LIQQAGTPAVPALRCTIVGLFRVLNRTAIDVGAALRLPVSRGSADSLSFFWDDFCDWYIELSKNDVTAEEPGERRNVARSRLLSVLEQALRLPHPFILHY
jgi:valyl-tRNA synthetase